MLTFCCIFINNVRPVWLKINCKYSNCPMRFLNYIPFISYAFLSMYYGKPSKARFYGSCHLPHTRATFCSPTKSKRDLHKFSCSATPIAGYSASLTRNNQHNVVFRTLIGGRFSRTKKKQEQANRLMYDFKLKELLGIRLLGNVVFSPSFSFYLKYDRNRIISVVNTTFHNRHFHQ